MSIVPDKLYHLGGVAVGSSRDFEGWWGGETFFVDYDNGTTGVRGDEMGRPQKHLRIAINNAGTDDTVYVRPRAFATGTYGEDPQQITPDTAANWAVTSKPNLSLIGTGKGLGTGAVHKCWIGGYSAITTAIITLNSPGCVVDGFRMQPGSSTSGLISSSNSGTATVDGGNQTIINNEFHDAGTAGAIRFEATWQSTFAYNKFMNCNFGVYLTASYSEPTFIEIRENQFVAITTEVQADVYSSGGVKRLRSHGNQHCAGQPAAGAPNLYYSFGAASTGMVSNNSFGVDNTTQATLMTLNGVLQSNNWSQAGVII